jgi:hypothetical protein
LYGHKIALLQPIGGSLLCSSHSCWGFDNHGERNLYELTHFHVHSWLLGNYEYLVRPLNLYHSIKLNSVAWVSKRTILTELLPLIGKVSANVCGG